MTLPDALTVEQSVTEPWWVRIPERLKHELQALEAFGVPYERDETAFAQGIARLRVRPVINGQEQELLVTFPDLYPFFRFTIEAPGDERLPHHQSPVGPGRLCFLGRATDNWHTSYTVADMLAAQVPRVFEAGGSSDRDVVAELEERQAEPFSEWYPYTLAMLYIDGAWRIPDHAMSGEFQVLLTHVSLGPKGHLSLFGFVAEVRDQAGTVVVSLDRTIVRAYQGHRITGRWTRAAVPIASFDAEDMFAKAAALDVAHKDASWEPVTPLRTGPNELQMQLRGVIFPEEHAWRDATGQGWVFVVRGRTREPAPLKAPSGGSRYLPRSGKNGRPGSAPVMLPWKPQHSGFVKAGRAGASDLAQRIPQLAPLREARVTIVGLGCIGAPSALELARAQVADLRLLDGDTVDPGTVVRWPYGLSAAGRPKALVLSHVISQDHPRTMVRAEVRRLGDPRMVATEAADELAESDQAILDRLTAGASLVYDASAEFGVQWFLSEFARERGLPYIAVTGTQGGWGGRIVRIRPGITEGCWACVQTARTEGDLPDPPADANGLTRPAGCAEATFTATSFDMVTLAMHGVRLAVSTLCGGLAGAYPSVDWDVAVIALRDEVGRLIAPTVQTFALPRHPRCPACARRP